MSMSDANKATTCSAVQSTGRLKGRPCPIKASFIVDGAPLCSNHARLRNRQKILVPVTDVAARIAFLTEIAEACRRVSKIHTRYADKKRERLRAEEFLAEARRLAGQ